MPPLGAMNFTKRVVDAYICNLTVELLPSSDGDSIIVSVGEE